MYFFEDETAFFSKGKVHLKVHLLQKMKKLYIVQMPSISWKENVFFEDEAAFSKGNCL
jgi:hypothetical protein